jgi:chromosome segregation ATPase
MKYIQNIHTAPITAVVKNAKGAVVLAKKFSPSRVDKFTGRVEETGFTQLTDEEYKLLNEGSRTFTVYRDKHKLLVEHDDLPPEAKTPHEALVDARKEARKAATQIAALNDEIMKLKAGLLDAETKYKELQSASPDAEGLKALRQNLADITGERDVLKKENEKLKKENDDLKAAGDKSGKGKQGKEFD